MAETFENVRMLLIDNYDSFTYNLVQAFAAQGADVMVYRNDAITVDEALELDPTHLVISPGPGRPEDAGVSLDMIAAFADKIPVLGVCLGHQSLVHHFGGSIVRAEPRRMRAAAPRLRARKLDADLEAIVFKTLEKKPEERYPEARALGDDLKRWLDDRPVTARRVTTVHRLRDREMGWLQIPLFTWSLYATAWVQLLATPIVGITLVVVLLTIGSLLVVAASSPLVAPFIYTLF